MKCFNLNLLFLLVGLSVSAQSNYRNAFIITNDNDTVYGSIDFRTNWQNQERCKFRAANESEETVYYPGDIEGFRFIDDGKFYVTRTIEVDKVLRTTFVEFLVQGEMNLYYYIENQTDYYFFEDETGQIIPVWEKKVIVRDAEHEHLPQETDNRYKGKLAYIFRNSEELSKKSRSAEFDRKTMVEYTKEYHDYICTTGKECIVFENDYKKKFLEWKFSAYSGVQVTNYAMNYYEAAVDVTPLIGGQVTMSSPRFIKSLGLMLDLSLSKLFVEPDGLFTFEDRQYTYDLNALNIIGNLNLKYTFHKGKVRPVVEGGATMAGLLFKSTSPYKDYEITDLEMSYKYQSPPMKYSYGYNVGVGIDYQLKEKQFLFLRLCYSNVKTYVQVSVLTNTPGVRTKSDFYQLKLGYTF